MAQQIGRELLIKAGNGASPEVFTNICGIKTRSFNMSANEVDTTVPDCDNPGNLPQKTSAPGILDQSFSGSGLFTNTAAGKQMLDDARTGVIRNYQVVVPGYGTMEGPYAIFDMELSGELEGNLEFSATFRQTGALTFTAEPE